MANKNPHKRLQRITKDETGKPAKLSFCLRLMQSNPKREEETHEAWATRVYLENETALRTSAHEKSNE